MNNKSVNNFKDVRDYFNNNLENILYVKGFCDLQGELMRKGYEVKSICFNEPANKDNLKIFDFTTSNLKNKIEIKSWILKLL